VSGSRGSRARLGCGVVAVVVVGAAIFGGGGAFVAWRQVRDARPEPRTISSPVPEAPGDLPVRIDLDVAIAQAVIVPAPAGAALTVEADYDPRRYALVQETVAGPDGRPTWSVRFGPTGSKTLALLGMKMGGVPPVVRIGIPRGVAVELAGKIAGGLAALELGGLRVSAAEFHVRSGAIDVSFAEPLEAPMERLAISGDRGSLEVTGLGNASPRVVDVRQHLGELDLDLRGAWVRDADLTLDARMAGGAVWLPAGADVVGLGTRPPRADVAGELPRPTLRVDVVEQVGKLVVVDPTPPR